MLVIYCSSVEAEEWRVNSTINQSLSYDDNFTMTEDPEGSMIYRLLPTLGLTRKTGVWDIEAGASYGVQTYTNKIVQDQKLQNYGLSTVYKTSHSNLGLRANYSITPTRNTALESSGNFVSNASSDTWSVSPSYSYQLTGQDSFISSASYSKTAYSATDINSTNSTTGFNDSENQSINLGWQHKWTERLDFSLSPFYSNFKSALSESSSYGINLSSNYSISKQWLLSGTIGGRITDTTIETTVSPGQNVVDQSTSQGFLADLKGSYTGKKLSSSFGISRSLVPAAQGQLTEQTVIGFNLSYKLSERLSSNFGASYQQTDAVNNNSVRNGAALNRTNIMFITGLGWKLTQDCNLEASYQHKRQEIKNPDTITADSNLFMLTLNYNWPGLNVSR